MEILISFIIIVFVLIIVPVWIFSKILQILTKFEVYNNQKNFLIAIFLISLILCETINWLQNLFVNNFSHFNIGVPMIDPFISIIFLTLKEIHIKWIWETIFLISILNILILTFLKKRNILKSRYLVVVGISFGILAIIILSLLSLGNIPKIISFLPIWLSYQSLEYLFMAWSIFVNEKLLSNTSFIVTSGLRDGTIVNCTTTLPAFAFLFYLSSKFVSRRWKILRMPVIIIGCVMGICLFLMAPLYDSLLVNIYANKNSSSVETTLFFVIYFFVVSQLVSLIHEWGHIIPVRYHRVRTSFVFIFNAIGGIKALCMIPSRELTIKNRIEVALMGHLWSIIFLTPIWIIFIILQVINYEGVINQLIYLFVVIIFFITLSFIVTSFTSPTSDGSKILSDLKLKARINKINKDFKPILSSKVHIIENSGRFYLTDQSGSIVEINPFGKIIIEKYFNGNIKIGEIISKLSQEFPDVPVKQIENDVVSFTKELAEKRILSNFGNLEAELTKKIPFTIHTSVPTQ